GASFPRGPQGEIDPVETPDREHVRGVAAADPDDVRLRDAFGGLPRRPEQLDMKRIARVAEGTLVERDNAPRIVGGRGRQVAEARPRPTTQLEQERREVAVTTARENPTRHLRQSRRVSQRMNGEQQRE